MKKVILSFFILSILAVSPVMIQTASADLCIPGDPDYDASDCLAQGGTIGSPFGSGGPGGANDVPIDGGLSIMLAVGGAISARKAFKNRKK